MKKVFIFVFISLSALLIAYQNCGKPTLGKSSLVSSTTIQSPGGQIEFTPSGCTDSATPVCNGSQDFVRKAWGTNGVTTNATSADGALNTQQILAADPTAPAALFCAQMVYGGFNDWYLPSKEELKSLFNRQSELGILQTDYYWSSTEISLNYAYLQTLIPFNSDGTASANEQVFKAPTMYVRCIRKKSN